MIYNCDTLNFVPIFISRSAHPDGFFDVKARPFAAICFRVSGKGEFEVNNKRLVTNKGDILFIPAYTPYKVFYQNSVSIVAHLEDCNYFEAENINISDTASVEQRFQRLLLKWQEKHSVNKTKALIYDILEKISEDMSAGVENAQLAQCISYMNEHCFDPNLSIQNICKKNFISSASFYRQFNEHFEMSPKQYLIKLRMDKALELLISNELSVYDVSIACGFDDVKYFSRAFKKKYGYPPSQLRNHMAL